MPRELGRGVGRLCVIAAVGAVPGGVCSWRNLEDVSVTTEEGTLIAGDPGVVGGGSIKSEIGVISLFLVFYLGIILSKPVILSWIG